MKVLLQFLKCLNGLGLAEIYCYQLELNSASTVSALVNGTIKNFLDNVSFYLVGCGIVTAFHANILFDE